MSEYKRLDMSQKQSKKENEIVALIGKPKIPTISKKILTRLVEGSQYSKFGFWAADNDNVYCSPDDEIKNISQNEKEQELHSAQIDTILVCCNNKLSKSGPSVTKDFKTALAFFGNIPEYGKLKCEYRNASDEEKLLLNMFDSGHSYSSDYIKEKLGELYINNNQNMLKELKDEELLPEWSQRLMGIIDIVSRTSSGDLTFITNEIWNDGAKSLFLFNTTQSRIYLIDLRKELGQILAFSFGLKEFRKIINQDNEILKYFQKSEIIELPSNSIWMINQKPNSEWFIKKIKVFIEPKYNTTFEKERPERNQKKISTKKVTVHI